MSNPINCNVIIRLSQKNSESDSAFGPGIAELLRLVNTSGSLNKAAKTMHMAYSKAWRIIRNTELLFGFDLIDRDGPRGSTLTEKGSALLALYDEMQAAADKAARDVLENNSFKF